jgi:hypothetical protein
MDDEDLLTRARLSKNGPKFTRLWDGDATDYDGDLSKADLALVGMLAYWTGGDAERIDRLFRQSGLMRDKWERADYRERTIARALADLQQVYTPTATPRTERKRQDRRETQHYDWQERTETALERNRLLRQVAERAKERVRAHFEARETSPLVVALPPGVGKSHQIAELGLEFDIAWISERHDMRKSVPALRDYYRAIQPCTEVNCLDFRRHEALAMKGRNTWPLHRAHGCDYYTQHTEEGSAVYQIPHVETAYPKRHEAIIADELNLGNWLPERIITHNAIQAVLASPYLASSSDIADLMRALRETLTTAQREDTEFFGKALFDALDAELEGQLEEVLGRLEFDARAVDMRPVEPIELSLGEIENLSPVVVPYVYTALSAELPQWRSCGEWNSSMHIAPGDGHGWALHLIEPRQFRTFEGEELPPWAILDATADTRLLELLLGQPVQLVSETVPPPPRMRHIAVRTGKRYNKYSLVEGKYSDRARERVVAEATYVLRGIEGDGTLRRAGKVGLITFQGAEDALGEALGMPDEQRGHFWGMRGSNALEDCSVLLIIGTPTPNLDQVEWWARALYRDDPTPIDTTTEKDEDGRPHYVDMRLRELVDHLTYTELTQCAHRNRPLRYDGRTVVTFCLGEIGYLPATETITALPQLTASGEEHAEIKREADVERLEEAARRLMERGERLTVEGLRSEARLARDTVARWLRKRRAEESAAPDEQTTCVPESA